MVKVVDEEVVDGRGAGGVELRFVLMGSMMLSGVVLGVAVEGDMEVVVLVKKGFPRRSLHFTRVAVFLQEAKSLVSADR